MSGSNEEKQFTIFNWIWLGYLGIATAIVVLLSLSPFHGPYVDFILSRFLWIPWVFFGVSVVVRYVTNVSIFPIGDADDDTYIIQKYFGYDKALIFAIVASVIFAGFIAIDVLTTNQLYLPVSPVYISGVATSNQVISDYTFQFFSGTSAVGTGLSASIPAELLEDTLSIMISMIFALGIRFGLSKSGIISEDVGTIVGTVAFILIYPVFFGFVLHTFAYQASDVALTRVFTFGLIGGTLAMLSGFILPVMMGHIANNFIGATAGLVAKGSIIPSNLIQGAMPGFALPTIMVVGGFIMFSKRETLINYGNQVISMIHSGGFQKWTLKI